jgi:type I restriction enzyme S subunit
MARIETGTSGLATTISRLEREINLLREYRTRLVADVVTGKLDVRAAAAALPAEAPLDDATASPSEDALDSDELICAVGDV